MILNLTINPLPVLKPIGIILISGQKSHFHLNGNKKPA